MIRGEAGRLYDTFREQSIVAIGWPEIASRVSVGMKRKDIFALYLQTYPRIKRRTAGAGAGQIWRFLNEIQTGDHVITYSPESRTYLFGTVTGAASYRPEAAEEGFTLVRTVDWRPGELDRDRLSQTTKFSLGATMTVFEVPAASAAELEALADSPGDGTLPTAANIQPRTADDEEEEEEEEAGYTESAVLAMPDGIPRSRDPLEDVESFALERIKDIVARLDWDDMQELVAGILRAMGYKTQVAPAGPDRGKDIVASPDGFGFEHPRIVVEVKHRTGKIGSPSIRSFLGGRHQDDRGLYVSTGGFTKDAHYEADRASVPLTLWTMDTLVRALLEHYETADPETKRLVPLKRTYLPI